MTDTRDDIREAAEGIMNVCELSIVPNTEGRHAVIDHIEMRDAIEAALRAERARGREEAGEWRPIETAPRDGTSILYINGFDEIGHCRWSEAIDADYSSCWWDDERDDEVVPLWWMRPLPAPPAIRAKQKETGA